MNPLLRLATGATAGVLSMAFILGTLESRVNWRRMLFIGGLVGLGSGAEEGNLPR